MPMLKCILSEEKNSSLKTLLPHATLLNWLRHWILNPATDTPDNLIWKARGQIFADWRNLCQNLDKIWNSLKFLWLLTFLWERMLEALSPGYEYKTLVTRGHSSPTAKEFCWICHFFCNFVLSLELIVDSVDLNFSADSKHTPCWNILCSEFKVRSIFTKFNVSSSRSL